MKEKKIYGTFVEYSSKEDDKYGFVDEHQIRLEAGFSLIFALFAFISIVFFAIYPYAMIVIGVLWFDFIFKIFIKPESLFFWFIAKNILNKKWYKPYWVGSLQKKFAWKVWLVLSSFAFFCILIVSGFLAWYNILTESYEISQTLPRISWTAVPFTPPLIACILCIIFMFLESVLWYCVGCRVYAVLTKKGIIKRVEWQNCANWVCEMPQK